MSENENQNEENTELEGENTLPIPTGVIYGWDSGRNISDEMDSIEILSKIIYRGDYSCIKNVYVAGEVLV